VGAAPGSLHFVGKKRDERIQVSVIDYNAHDLVERPIEVLDELTPFRDTDTVTWTNIVGIHDTEAVQKIGEIFDIHALTLEDIVNATQRSKIEEFEDYLYIVIRIITFDPEIMSIRSEQLSMILGSNFVLSFQEDPRDVFEPVRVRIRNAVGRIRSSGADYLAYALLDVIIDEYFVTLEKIGEEMEDIEELVLENPEPETLERITALSRELVLLRRGIWPARELISSMLRSPSSLVKKKTEPFLRDAYDHTIQIMEIVESFRDVMGNLRESYKTAVSNRMNDIMKVLTIIATIFIPLTFIAGIYGMNFQYMPELAWQWGYFGALGFMVVLGLGLAAFFKAKKWF
jgi:magnesium transporter